MVVLVWPWSRSCPTLLTLGRYVQNSWHYCSPCLNCVLSSLIHSCSVQCFSICSPEHPPSATQSPAVSLHACTSPCPSLITLTLVPNLPVCTARSSTVSPLWMWMPPVHACLPVVHARWGLILNVSMRLLQGWVGVSFALSPACLERCRGLIWFLYPWPTALPQHSMHSWDLLLNPCAAPCAFQSLMSCREVRWRERGLWYMALRLLQTVDSWEVQCRCC